MDQSEGLTGEVVESARQIHELARSTVGQGAIDVVASGPFDADQIVRDT